MINLVPVSAVLSAESGGRPAMVIDTTDHDVIGYWAYRLNVSRDDLISAIEKVGNSVAAVRRHLES
ncbi:MAG TPA: DUF3606 domain-containing protein [Nitrobacter sp.]|jgi:hypothetical protein|nr:DUF3606 domain-containing protein [Nitrobacter sp.]